MSNVFKIKELVATRFLYATIGVDIKYVLNCCEQLCSNPGAQPNAGNEEQEKLYNLIRSGQKPVFDLCDCTFTSDISQIIFEWQDKGWCFIDSTNTERNSILVENQRRLQNKPAEIIPMPEYKLNTSAADYIKSLRTDVVYTYYKSSELYYALVIMTALLRPNVQFEMDNVMARILDLVSSTMSPALLSEYDEFYYHTNEGVEVLKAIDGEVWTQRLGKVTIESASYGGYLVPTVFGRAVLYKEPGWDVVFKNALNFVNKSKELRSKTLREVLVGE